MIWQEIVVGLTPNGIAIAMSNSTQQMCSADKEKDTHQPSSIQVVTVGFAFGPFPCAPLFGSVPEGCCLIGDRSGKSHRSKRRFGDEDGGSRRRTHF